MNENKIAATHYIINFYNHIQQLNSFYSAYDNLLLELEFKNSSDEELKNIEDSDKNLVNQAVQNIRHYINLIYIEYNSIAKPLKLAQQDLMEMNLLIDEIKKEFIIKKDKLLNFVIKINELLTSSVIQDLLTTSQDIYSQIYNETDKKTSPQ